MSDPNGKCGVVARDDHAHGTRHGHEARDFPRLGPRPIAHHFVQVVVPQRYARTVEATAASGAKSLRRPDAPIPYTSTLDAHPSSDRSCSTCPVTSCSTPTRRLLSTCSVASGYSSDSPSSLSP